MVSQRTVACHQLSTHLILLTCLSHSLKTRSVKASWASFVTHLFQGQMFTSVVISECCSNKIVGMQESDNLFMPSSLTNAGEAVMSGVVCHGSTFD